jgi:hypothetical protein
LIILKPNQNCHLVKVKWTSNNIHTTCFHFLKVYTKHAKHGLFTWYILSIHIGLLYNHVLWVHILHVITLFEYVARTQACMRCSFHFQVTIGYSINKPKDFHPKFNFLHFIGNYFRNLKVKSINASLWIFYLFFFYYALITYIKLVFIF